MRTFYFGGKVWTGNHFHPAADAFVTQDGRFMAVGSQAEVEGLCRAGDRRVNLGGRRVIPGLIDAHVHFSWFSFGLTEVTLDGALDVSEAVERVRTRVEQTPPGQWVRGSGFNANQWERWPTRSDLDLVAPEHPVVLSSKDCHSIWVNSAALREAGVGPNTPTPFGGEIERDLSGTPTGILKENATDLIWDALPPRTHEEYLSAMRIGIRRAHEVGVTGVHDMDPVACFKAFQGLQAAGELSIRVFKQIPESAFSGAVEAGLTTGFGNEWLRAGCLKLFADGSLGSQTAHMLEPFEGLPDYRGVPVHTRAELEGLISTAVHSNIAVAVHAIGDAANRVVLDSFQQVAQESKRRKLRHRIEHAQLLSAEDVPRFASLGIIASVQPSHAPSDRYTADRFWGTRSRLAYAFRSLLESGARLAFGSDVPVEPLDPLAGIHAAVWRKRLDEPNSQIWYPEQRLTVAEAVHGFTLGAAYASGEEGLKGSIEPGKLADFVVLSHDLFSDDEEVLRTVRPVATIVGGRTYYGDL